MKKRYTPHLETMSAIRFLPHNYTPNFVVYTGTHDNDTAWGWFNSCADTNNRRALAYLGAMRLNSTGH